MSFDELNKTDLGYNGFTDFEAGAQSRQAEIDDLVDMVKTSADSEMNLFDELQRVNKDRDELQKRIDLIVDLVHDQTTDYFLDNLIQDILKGNKND